MPRPYPPYGCLEKISFGKHQVHSRLVDPNQCRVTEALAKRWGPEDKHNLEKEVFALHAGGPKSRNLNHPNTWSLALGLFMYTVHPNPGHQPLSSTYEAGVPCSARCDIQPCQPGLPWFSLHSCVAVHPRSPWFNP